MRLSSGYLDKQLLSNLNKQEYDKLVKGIGNDRSQLNRQIISIFRDIDYEKPIDELIMKVKKVLIDNINQKKNSHQSEQVNSKQGNSDKQMLISPESINQQNTPDIKMKVGSFNQQTYKDKIEYKY